MELGCLLDHDDSDISFTRSSELLLAQQTHAPGISTLSPGLHCGNSKN